MKKKSFLFKTVFSNAKTSEEAMTLMYSAFHKILRLNLKKNTYEEIKVYTGEKHSDKGYSHNFSEWAKNFAMTGNIHKNDIENYLKFIDKENIKKLFLTEPKKYTVRYRRITNNVMRWAAMDLIPSENFSEKNQIVYMYVYDIHDSLSEELNNTQFMQMVSEAITRSHLNCVYINIKNNTSRIIYALDYIKEGLNEPLSIREKMKASVMNFTAPSYQNRMLEFCNLDTLGERLKEKTIISHEFIGNKGGSLRASFIPVKYGEDGSLESVIYTIRYVEGEILTLRGQLETEKALVECLTALSGTEDFSRANEKILKNIGEFYHAERAYIFTIDHASRIIRNEFEWCNENVAPQINSLQNVGVEKFSHWINMFNNKEIIFINDREKDMDPASPEYSLLKTYNVNSVIAVPFYDSIKNVVGFMGINEPKKNYDSHIVLRSAATYIMEEKLKQNYTEELYKLSYSDSMTKTLNRAAYIRDMEKLRNGNEMNTGILYADVNGLKDTNDNKGHEAGDILIESAVSLLRKYFSRKKDLIYRLGGDEFVVISSDTPQKEFQTVIANLKDELEKKWILSCGGAWFQRISDIDQATREAEKAMYTHKSEYYSSGNHVDRRQ
ncbi:GGDEF domain-containing protein [Treponema sp.]|uniref:sensor domain-containing diguanylate cyclase n=1 Tax=Treponema sp. TaxID=166 RepID=UPI0038901FA6